MAISLGVYWQLWGWKFALGFVLALYVHEMGHVAALRRYGVRASAPMFIPLLGAFVRLEEGLEGLIHISELAEGNFLHPRNVVQEGQTVTMRVLNIDSQNRRLGLSLRQVWQTESHNGFMH